MMTIQQAFDALKPLRATASCVTMECWQHNPESNQTRVSFRVSIHRGPRTCTLYQDGLLENAVHKALMESVPAQPLQGDHEALKYLIEETAAPTP